jgi:hypothetical protein
VSSASRIDPGCARRRDQPKRAAPRCRHSLSRRNVYGLPPMGSTVVSFANRSATGSMSNLYASSSIALSSAKNALISNGARMKPGVCVSSFTSREPPR